MARILVVDDEVDLCALLKEYLGRKGHEVSVATDGETALELIESERPHLMLLDICMPGIDGMEVMRRSRALEPRMKIIVITVAPHEEIARAALSLGASDCIIKPIDLQKLDMIIMANIPEPQD